MTLFQRRKYVLLGLLFFAVAVPSGALARWGKHEKPENPPVVEAGAEAKLMGQSAAQVTGFLGKPPFKRSENGAEVWQYSEGGCVLNLFLFEKAPLPDVRVQYLDVFALHHKPDEPVSPAERQRCLRVFTDHPAVPAVSAPK